MSVSKSTLNSVQKNKIAIVTNSEGISKYYLRLLILLCSLLLMINISMTDACKLTYAERSGSRLMGSNDLSIDWFT